LPDNSASVNYSEDPSPPVMEKMKADSLADLVRMSDKIKAGVRH